MAKKEDLRKKASAFFSNIRFYYVLFIVVASVIICIAVLVKNISETLRNVLISAACSVLSSVIVGFVFDFVNKNKAKNELLDRKELLTKRMAEKAVSAYYFVGRSFENTFFNTHKSIKELVDELRNSKKESFNMNNYAFYFLKFLYNDLERCFEGLFVGSEWDGINSALMYVGIASQNVGPTIRRNLLLNIFASLSYIRGISDSFNVDVYEYEYLREMRNVPISNIPKNNNLPKIQTNKSAIMGGPIVGVTTRIGPIAGKTSTNGNKSRIIRQIKVR